MRFFAKTVKGHEYFYPASELSEKFINAFPHSAGRRKCLTQAQIDLLKEIGVQYNLSKKEMRIKKDEDNNRGNRRLRRIPKKQI